MTLLLSRQVQVRAVDIIEDDEKSAAELWEFNRATDTKSNEKLFKISE